jgi:hypothetical protein
VCEFKANIARLLVVYITDAWIRMVATHVSREAKMFITSANTPTDRYFTVKVVLGVQCAIGRSRPWMSTGGAGWGWGVNSY